MKECSYCNEPLNEDEINYFDIAIDIRIQKLFEMPLCSDCLLKDW